MNHPKREEWVPYLFGEAQPEVVQELRQHLQSCADCRTEMDRWKQTLGRLEAWRLPRPARPREVLASLFRWAVATVVVLSFGFTVGRLSSAGGDPPRLREAVEPQIREELRLEMAQWLRQELTQASAATVAASGEQTKDWLAEFARTVEARLQMERAERIANCLSLKREVDTIAINADAGLRDTEQWLVQLADYRPPVRSSSPADNNRLSN